MYAGLGVGGAPSAPGITLSGAGSDPSAIAIQWAPRRAGSICAFQSRWVSWESFTVTKPERDGDGELEAMTPRDWVVIAPEVRAVMAELVEAVVLDAVGLVVDIRWEGEALIPCETKGFAVLAYLIEAPCTSIYIHEGIEYRSISQIVTTYT